VKSYLPASIKTFLVSVAKNIWLNEVKEKERSDFREKQFESGRDQKEVDVSYYISDLEKNVNCGAGI